MNLTKKQQELIAKGIEAKAYQKETLSSAADGTKERDPRLGIIYCARPGRRKKWKNILAYLNARGVRFDYVQSEGTADVERVAAMMTRSGYRTLVVVGGDAALNFAVNGIFSVPASDGRRPALGVIPLGYGNDFARYWGLDASDYRRTIDLLVAGRKRRVDVGRVRLTSARKDGGEQTCYFLNCVNVGVAASIVNLQHMTRSYLGLRTLSYIVSAFLLLFQRMSFLLDFSINGERFGRRAMTLCVGSAWGYGQTPSAVPYNGQLDVSLVTTPRLTQLFHGLLLLIAGRFLGHKGVEVWRTRRVSFHSVGRASVSVDGRFLSSDVGQLDVDIFSEEIEFLIP